VKKRLNISVSFHLEEWYNETEKCIHGGDIINQITLRGIPEEVKQAVRRIAQERNISMNKIINELLQNHSGYKHPR